MVIYVFILSGLSGIFSVNPADPKLPTIVSNKGLNTSMGLEELERLEKFQVQLTKTLKQKTYNRTKFGIQIRDEFGEVIFEHQPDLSLPPASTLKILTTSVALEKLGPNYQYHTRLLTDGTIQNGVLTGNLWILGTADPQLSGFFDPEISAISNRWVHELKVLGVEKISGQIYIDNRFFEDEDGENESIAKTVALFDKVQGNRISTVFINSKGKPIKQTIRLRRKSKRQYVSISMNHAFGNAFVDQLRKNAISHQDYIMVGYLPEHVVGLTLVTEHVSEPMYEIIKRTNKDSDNFYADQLVRTLGYEYGNGATLESGLLVIESFLRIRLLIDKTKFQLSDGSGLSHSNSINAETLNSVMNYMDKSSDNRLHFFNSLSIAGFDGTLKSRIKHRNADQVLGKTGSITGVSTLTGILTTQSGRKLYFSILGRGGSVKQVRMLEDKICQWMLDL